MAIVITAAAMKEVRKGDKAHIVSRSGTDGQVTQAQDSQPGDYSLCPMFNKTCVILTYKCSVCMYVGN